MFIDLFSLKHVRFSSIFIIGTFILLACVSSTNVTLNNPTPKTDQKHAALDPTIETLISVQRDPAIPELPFADNPDPSQCGIPTQWGDKKNQAWVTGIYKGNLFQSDVLLYDSHLRLQIAGSVPHGSQVEILLLQENPVVDYYLVKYLGTGQPIEGWIPAPFISFTPVK